ncbi:hypothetical protein FQN57_002255 [Myotisia sp. PD_48]|nr:hypothetical protein FQN57_002255 [Myotisia sp. PD_48]
MSFLDVSRAAEGNAADLVPFVEFCPARASQVLMVISHLYGICGNLHALETAHNDPKLRDNFAYIAANIELVIKASLRKTLRDIYDSVGRLKLAINVTNRANENIHASGGNPVDTRSALHMRTWTDMAAHFRHQSGYSLNTRLVHYQGMLSQMLNIVRRLPYDAKHYSKLEALIIPLRATQDRYEAYATTSGQVPIDLYKDYATSTPAGHDPYATAPIPGQFPSYQPYLSHLHTNGAAGQQPPFPFPPLAHTLPIGQQPPPPAAAAAAAVPIQGSYPPAPKPRDKTPDNSNRRFSIHHRPSYERERRWSQPGSNLSQDETSTALTLTDSNSGDDSRKVSHWSKKIFNSGLQKTLLERTGRLSKSYGSRMVYPQSRLDKAYDRLLEIDFFEDPPMSIFFYLRDNYRARILCRMPSIKHGAQCSTILLTDLTISREDSCIKLHRVNKKKDIWLRLEFDSIEYLVYFYCTFLALRSQDSAHPVNGITDNLIKGEKRVFQGEILENGFNHQLRLLKDRSTGAVRLESVIVEGDMKNVPVWTAFITAELKTPFWFKRTGTNTVSMASLNQGVFMDSDAYTPTVTARGAHMLRFVNDYGWFKLRPLVSC